MKVTRNGQVTIPIRIREYLGITPQRDVEFRITDGVVVLVNQESRHRNGGRFSDLRGALRGMRTTREWLRATRGADICSGR